MRRLLSDLVHEFDAYIRTVDPDASFNYADPSKADNHTVWNVRGTVKGRGNNYGAELSLIVDVRRWCTRWVDENGYGGMADPIVDALYAAFDNEFVTSSYYVDTDDKSEHISHTWNVEYTSGVLNAH